jgi:hypothetical protein
MPMRFGISTHRFHHERLDRDHPEMQLAAE